MAVVTSNSARIRRSGGGSTPRCSMINFTRLTITDGLIQPSSSYAQIAIERKHTGWSISRQGKPDSTSVGGAGTGPAAVLTDRRPVMASAKRNELIHRLRAGRCEICESTVGLQVHHIRELADLNQPGRPKKPSWMHLMAMRRRKTLVTCHRCQRTSTPGGPRSPTRNDHWRAGCRETARPVREEDDGKGPTPSGTSPAPHITRGAGRGNGPAETLDTAPLRPDSTTPSVTACRTRSRCSTHSMWSRFGTQVVDEVRHGCNKTPSAGAATRMTRCIRSAGCSATA